MRFSRLFAAAVAATVLLAAGVGTASAGRFSSSSQTFRETWTRVRFSDDRGSDPVTCPVTLEGSMHARSFAKVRESLIGYITRAVIGTAVCTGGPNGGSAEFATETLPWHVTYESFSGTLPNVTGVSRNVIGMEAWIRSWVIFLPIWTHIRTAREEPLRVTWNREAGGAISSSRIDETRTIISREGETASRVSIEGTGGVTALNTTTRVTVTLI